MQAQSPSPPARPAVAETLTAARAALDQGHAPDAIKMLGALDRSDPKVAELLGVAYYRADDYPHAIELLAPLVPTLPTDSIERREAVQVLGLVVLPGGPSDGGGAAARRNEQVGDDQYRVGASARDGVHPDAAARQRTRRTGSSVRRRSADSSRPRPGCTDDDPHRVLRDGRRRAEGRARRRSEAAACELPARHQCDLSQPDRRGHRASRERTGHQPGGLDGALPASEKPGRVVRPGTRPFLHSSDPCGSTPTTAGPTSCWAARIWRPVSSTPREACCSAPWRWIRTTSRRAISSVRSSSGWASPWKPRSSSTSRTNFNDSSEFGVRNAE